MTPANDEELLHRRVHAAIDAVLPRAGVEERLSLGARERIARGDSASRIPWMPLQRGLGGALVAFVVVALLGGVLGLSLALRSHATPATTPPPEATPLPHHPPTPVVAPPSPTPATGLDFGSASYSFSSPSDGWTLGSACDVQNNCTFGIYKTTDGGQHWVHVAFPYPVDGGDFSLKVTAASSTDAWVWGSPSSGQDVLDATHDGGRSWQQMSTGSSLVGDIVVSGGTASAVTTCATTVPCTAHLFSQPVAGGRWAELLLPESVQSPIDNNGDEPLAQLLREGGRMWVLDANQQRPALVRSDDNGHIWTTLPAPPCHSGATMILSASSQDQLMLACANEGGWPAPQEVWTSSNGGSAWVLRSRAGYNMDFSPPEPNVGSINSGGAPIGLVELSSTTAWMANDREDDLVTHDGGVTWTHAALPPDQFGGAGGAEGIGFTDALHGWTFCSGGLWTTGDGGVTWHEQPGITIPAS